VPSWPEYLEALEGWLDRIGPELDPSARVERTPTAHGGITPPARRPREGAQQPPLPVATPPMVRPVGLPPADLLPRALAVQARLLVLITVGDRRRAEVMAARQRVQLRRLSASGRRGAVSAEL
jgi:hypothetical protein